MIEGGGIDDLEAIQVIFERNIVSMPGDHIERRMILH